MSSQTTSAPVRSNAREAFGGRWIFILAAMGSAIGLGNIWRFPYIAYDNGGELIIPYLVALLSAGIRALLRRNRPPLGSPPLAFRRLAKWTETIGWWKAMICVVIGLYYAYPRMRPATYSSRPQKPGATMQTHSSLTSISRYQTLQPWTSLSCRGSSGQCWQSGWQC